MTRSAPILRVEDVTLAFRGVTALAQVSFEVARGEICALIGPNGAGKSSLLNVISGVYRAQRGHVEIAGVRRRARAPREAAELGVARTFQNIALWRTMTVLDNLITGRTLRVRATVLEQALGIGRVRREESASRAAVEDVIERLDLAAVRHEVVGRLSYGLQKRVELGRALAAEPRLLLLDEPMAGMTFDEKREMSRALLEVNRDLGTTLVLIEHDMGVVMDLAHHVVVLDYGRKIADGAPAAVRGDSRVIDAYLGVAHDQVA